MNKKLFIPVILIVVIVIVGFLAFFLNRQTGQAKLSWNKSTGFNVSGYRVYYGRQPRIGNCPVGGYSEKVDVGNTTTYQIGHLKNNSTYYFSVTSYNNQGKESCFSEEMSKQIKINLFSILKI